MSGKDDEFKAERITISLPKRLLRKIDKIKRFPKWKDNRSAVIEELVEQGLSNEPEVKEDDGSKSGCKARSQKKSR